MTRSHAQTAHPRGISTSCGKPIARHAKPVGEDWERYQTVYARTPGSVAAPTAGLHFSDALLAALREGGIEVHAVTPGRLFNLGSTTDAAAAVELCDAELDRFFTPTLRVGDATAGPIFISRVILSAINYISIKADCNSRT